LYKKNLYHLGGYLVDRGQISLDRVEVLLTQLGEMEDTIFSKQLSRNKVYDERRKRNDEVQSKLAQESVVSHAIKKSEDVLIPLGEDTTEKDAHRKREIELLKSKMNENKSAAKQLKKSLMSDIIEELEAEELEEETKTQKVESNQVVKSVTEDALIPLGEDTTEKDEHRKNEIDLLKSKISEKISEVKQLEQSSVTNSIQELEAEELEENQDTPMERETNIESKKRKHEEIIESTDSPSKKIKLDESLIQSEQIQSKEEMKDKVELVNLVESENKLKLDKMKFKEVYKKRIDQSQIVDEEKHPDDVRLGEPGWKERYYSKKFRIQKEETSEEKRRVVQSYVEGLMWVMKYYYEGCPSWSWYYQYHYSPFSSDFQHLSQMNIKFEKGEPFHPFEQLLAVL
jgi:5'-3' exoribonuclease 2